METVRLLDVQDVEVSGNNRLFDQTLFWGRGGGWSFSLVKAL